MTLYREAPGPFPVWAGEPIDGVLYQREIEQLWQPVDLEAINLWRHDMIAAADPVPAGKRVISSTVERIDGVVRYVHVLEDIPRPAGEEINAERDRRIEAGATFAVSGYGTIPLQGRLKDQINLQSRLIAAQAAKAAGVTDPVLVLRDAADVNHMLTPDQTIELVSKGVAWIEDTMQVSWDMKDGAPPFADGAPYDYADDGYWP